MAIIKEKIEYFALVAEILGGLGVIISVIYLAAQVGDGNRALRSQNHHNALTLTERSMEMLIADKELAEIYVAGKAGDKKLTEADAQRLQYFIFLELNAWEFGYYQNADGAIPPQLWEGQDAWMRDEARTNVAFRDTWKEMKNAFAEPFRTYAEKIVFPSGQAGAEEDR